MERLKQSKILRKVISVVLSIALFLSCFVVPGITASAESETEYWSGKTTAPAKGSGTLADPYLIETAEEFAYMLLVANGGDNWDQNAVYSLQNDIYLNDISKINWFTGEVAEDYTPNIWQPEHFSGIIQGNGHMVYGLYIERNPEAYAEKFTAGTGAALICDNWVNKWLKITDMGMDYVYVNSANVSGVFVSNINIGSTSNPRITIKGSYIGSNVTVKGFAAGGFIGGGYGVKAVVQIKNCVSHSTGYYDYKSDGTRRNKAGAIVGDAWGCDDDSVENCYAFTKIYGNGAPGYADGVMTGSLINNYSCETNTYITGISVANMQGMDVLENSKKMPLLGSGFVPTETFPLPIEIYSNMMNKDKNISVWSGDTTAPTKGSGTTSDPYLIETAEEFAYMLLEANGGAAYDKGATYKLMNDIYLNDISKINWTTGEPVEGYTPNVWEPEHFSGIIYGNGHTVYGLYIERNPEAYTENWGAGAALISVNWSNKWIQINDMGMDCVYVNSPNISAVYVASANGDDNTQFIFSGCYIGSRVTVKGFAVGGFFGGGAGSKMYLKANNCMSLATNFSDNGRNRSGSILGDVWGPENEKIDNCYALTRIYGNNKPTGSLTNNYSAVANKDVTTIDIANMKGDDVLSSASKMPNLGSGYVATEEFPYPAAFYGTLIEEKVKTGQVWNGSTAPCTVGDGTEASPYEIATAEQLAYAVSSGNEASYRLVADIYLNDTDKIDWSTGAAAEGYTPNSWYADKLFSGTIDGNGHVIYGLYYNDNDTERAWGWSGVGLIPRVTGGKTATLKNLGIEKAYVNGPQAVGGLFGNNQSGVAVAEKCYLGADVTLSGYETGAFLGLDTGEFHFTNCYSHASLVRGVDGNSACDIGLLGEFYSWPAGDKSIANSTVEFCYNTNCGGSTKGAPGKANNVFGVSSVGFTTALSAAQMQGTVLDTNRMTLSDAYIATETYPVLKVFTDVEENFWNGLAHGFTMGDGESSETAYEIFTPGQLAYAVACAGNGKYYRLVNDVYLNDIIKIDWTTGLVKEGTDDSPVKWFKSNNAGGTVYNSAFGQNLQFQGKFDGCGHTVYGLLNDNDGVSTVGGLFLAAVNTEIKNLQISNSFIASGRFGGAVAGYFGGNLENVTVSDTVSVYGYESINHESSSIGGIVGYTNYVTLKNCAFTGKMTATSAVGHVYSLVGTSWASAVKAENCFGIGRQPYTVSHSAKHFDTEQDAKDYFSNLYAASNVYTDTKAKDNKVSFTYGSNKTSGTYVPFSFVMLNNADMKSDVALTNMPALDKNFWTSTEGYPVLKRYITALGDIDFDGAPATYSDADTVRKAIIGIDTSLDTDYIGDGATDIFDLVKLRICRSQRVSGETTYTYAEWNGIGEKLVYYMIGDNESESAANQLKDAAAKRGDNLMLRGGLSYGSNQIFFFVDKLMRPAEYNTAIVGSNIVVTAGSGNALVCAAEKIGELYTEDFIPLVRGVCDYDETITLSSGNTYSYVWGDEFYGTTLDRNKWVNTTSNSRMSGFYDLKLLDTEEAVFVKDGKLTLRAMEYTDPNDENIKYAVPASVHSQGTMEYRYGYAEIYARVPFKAGVWPSFWATSNTTLGERKCYDYAVEVDVFEIFGNVNTVVPNIHKWYHDYDYNTNHNQTTNSAMGHTQLANATRYKYTNYSDLSNEFHLYGFEWTPTELNMYVDGYLYSTIDIVNSYDLYEDMSGYQDPLFLIFNNHIFSPGCIEGHNGWEPSNITGYEEENLPADYQIDWLRIYQNRSVEGSAVYTK